MIPTLAIQNPKRVAIDGKLHRLSSYGKKSVSRHRIPAAIPIRNNAKYDFQAAAELLEQSNGSEQSSAGDTGIHFCCCHSGSDSDVIVSDDHAFSETGYKMSQKAALCMNKGRLLSYRS